MTDEYAIGILLDLKDVMVDVFSDIGFLKRDLERALTIGMMAIAGEPYPKKDLNANIALLQAMKNMFKGKFRGEDADDIDGALQKAIVRLIGSDYD